MFLLLSPFSLLFLLTLLLIALNGILSSFPIEFLLDYCDLSNSICLRSVICSVYYLN